MGFAALLLSDQWAQLSFHQWKNGLMPMFIRSCPNHTVGAQSHFLRHISLFALTHHPKFEYDPLNPLPQPTFHLCLDKLDLAHTTCTRLDYDPEDAPRGGYARNSDELGHQELGHMSISLRFPLLQMQLQCWVRSGLKLSWDLAR